MSRTDTPDLVARLLAQMPALELMRVVSLDEAARLRGDVSTDTLIREDKQRVADGKRSRIVQLSPRRRGMRVVHAICADSE
jgi:hypothetical protein